MNQQLKMWKECDPAWKIEVLLQKRRDEGDPMYTRDEYEDMRDRYWKFRTNSIKIMKLFYYYFWLYKFKKVIISLL
jgi:hypothetical protein